MADDFDWVKKAAAERASHESAQKQREDQASRAFADFRSRAGAMWEPIQDAITAAVGDYNSAIGFAAIEVDEQPSHTFLRLKQSIATLYIGIDDQERQLRVTGRGPRDAQDHHRTYPLKINGNTGEVFAEGVPAEPPKAARVLLEPWIRAVSEA